MSGINRSGLLSLSAFALAFLLKGGRSPEAFALIYLSLAAIPAVVPSFGRTWKAGSQSLLPFLIIVLWCAATTVSAPPLAPHLYRLCQLTAYCLFAWVALSWSGPERLGFVHVLTVVALADAMIFLATRARSPDAAGYLVGNPGYSALLYAGALLFFWARPRSRTGNERVAVAVACLLLVAALALIRSRSTLVGLAVAAAFLAPRKRYLAVAGGTAAVLLCVALLAPGALLTYLKIDPHQPAEWLGRLRIWETAFRALSDHPVTGWGLGNFEAAYLRHQVPSGHILNFDKTSPFAHNDYLQLAVEAGWPALLVLLWALGTFFWRTRSLTEWTAKGGRAVVALYATAALFNFTLLLPLNGLLGAGAVGLALGASAGAHPRAALPGRWLAVPVGILALFLVVNGTAQRLASAGRPEAGARLLPIRADLAYQSALAALRRSDDPDRRDKAIAWLQASLKWNEQDPFVWNRLGMLSMGVSRPPLPAQSSFSRAIDLAPRHAPFWIDAGFERLRVGETAEAVSRFQRAAELEPRAPMPVFALAAAAAQEGDAKTARTLLNSAGDLRRRFGGRVPRSGYADFLFGMTEESMRTQVDVLLRSKSPSR